MAEIPRYLTEAIHRDAIARRKIAMISGPRQVGKSTLAKSLLASPQNYFLYDDEDFRRRWSKSPREAISGRGDGVVVLDEIHKDRKWKARLKGLYDTLGRELPFVVTGSARLEHFRKGGDSLMGRYFPYRLFPFTVAEGPASVSPDAAGSSRRVRFPWGDLMRFGGFPEPLLGGSELEAQRWSRLRIDRLVLEDSRDFLNISDLNAFRVLIDLLPERVGSLLSVNALREDVGKAYGTVRSWMGVLEALYHSFTIRPYSTRLSRALRAGPKLYLFDTLAIPTALWSKRLENQVAIHLLKACTFWTDTAQGEFDLRFVRTKEQREVDFLILRERKPWMLVECKTSETEPAKDLIAFTRSLKPPHSIQLVSDESIDRRYAEHGITVQGYERFLSGLV